MVYNHHESIKTVQNRQDRALITLAALLKNKYGISGNGGKLLTHDLKKDISLDHGTHPYLQSLIDKFKNEFDDALPVVIMNFDYLSVMRFEGCLKEYYHTNNPTKLAQFLYSNIKDTNRNAVFSMINALYKLAELRNLILQYHTEENSKDDFNHLSFFNSAKTQKAIANQETKQFPEFVALESELAILHVKINEHLTLFTALPDQKERITFHYLYFSAYRTGQTDLLKSFLVKKLSKEAEIDKFIRHLVRYIEINKKMKEIVDASSDASLKEGFSEFPKLVQQLNAFKLTNALEWLERLPEHQKVIKESDSVIAQKQKSTPRNDLRLANAANTLKLSRFIGAPYDHRPYSVHNPLSWRQTWTRWRLPKEFIQLRSLALTKDLTPHILFGFAQDVPLNKESIEKTYLQLKNTIELQKNSAIEEIRVQADTLLKLVESANDLLNEEMEALLSLAN